MKKKEYIKPSFKIIDIQLNELCAGSVCTEVDISVEQGNKEDRTNVFIQGQTKEFWDSSF